MQDRIARTMRMKLRKIENEETIGQTTTCIYPGIPKESSQYIF